jgi:hypothetical protein
MTMAAITEDYVSFEVAKFLKEKGFNERLFTFYTTDEAKKEGYFELMAFTDDKIDNNHSDHCYLAPTLQMAMKWLREVHGLHISLEPYYDYDSMHVVFLAFVQNVADVHEFMDGRKNVASHPNAEKSYELAIKYCLENLI